jgi:aminoglycoside phosphotransferase (APT) family kinase protein
MTNIWDSSIKIDEKLIIHLINSQTDITATKIELIGEGFDNYAYLINQEFIFRFPRRESAVTCMANEIILVPYIAKHVSFPISAPQFIGKASDAYPFIFAGYPMIKGIALSEASNPLVVSKIFAHILANWLKELHSIKVKSAHQQIVKNEHNLWRLNIPNRIEALSKSVNQYAACYQAAGFTKEKLLKLINNFHKLDFNLNESCYLHGDLYARHIMVDQNLLPIGLIDWGDAHIGQPGIDLSAVILIFNDNALNEFFKIYGMIDHNSMKIAIFRAICHSIICLPYADQQNAAGLKNWSIAALNRAIDLLSHL